MPLSATITPRKSSAPRQRGDWPSARSESSERFRRFASGAWAGLRSPAKLRHPNQGCRSLNSSSVCARSRSRFHAGLGKAVARGISTSSTSICRSPPPLVERAPSLGYPLHGTSACIGKNDVVFVSRFTKRRRQANRAGSTARVRVKERELLPSLRGRKRRPKRSR